MGVVPIVPLKHQVEFYQKYRPENEVHLEDKKNSRRDTLHAEDVSN